MSQTKPQPQCYALLCASVNASAAFSAQSVRPSNQGLLCKWHSSIIVANRGIPVSGSNFLSCRERRDDSGMSEKWLFRYADNDGRLTFLNRRSMHSTALRTYFFVIFCGECGLRERDVRVGFTFSTSSESVESWSVCHLLMWRFMLFALTKSPQTRQCWSATRHTASWTLF